MIEIPKDFDIQTTQKELDRVNEIIDTYTCDQDYWAKYKKGLEEHIAELILLGGRGKPR